VEVFELMSVTQDLDREATWGFEEGDEIVPGRYALRLLGGGNHHQAYLAWDERLFALVVAKIIRPGHVDARAMEALEAEAAALSRLRHPVLVRSFGAVLEGERPHLVLEFLEGPRLSTLLRKYGPLSVEQLFPLALQLCSAARYLEIEEMVHLDVKPRNVVMGASARLVDLGIARTFDDALRTSGPIGTDRYMAPEQCGVDGTDRIGPAADIWGIGVTLYEALTRTHPFPPPEADGTPEGRWPQLVHDPGPLPKHIPGEVVGPLLACLEARPERRPTALELAEALRPLVAAAPWRPRIGPLRLGVVRSRG
jgi:serine/threonine-protein kinase